MEARPQHGEALRPGDRTAVTADDGREHPVIETVHQGERDHSLGGRLQPGRDVGPYRLERQIGEGGMGVVWRARRRHGGLVAIKFLRRASHLDQAGIAEEFRVQASLHHPHVMPVFDHGMLPATDAPGGPGHPYLVMPWIEDARTLDAYVAEHAIDARGRIRLFLAVAAGLAHAHAKGVIHRDLKPANILVDRYGHLRLCDFGLAGLTFDGVAAASSGTPGYRAPEQVREREADLLDQRTDVWALGVILHELLTGQRPDEAATWDAIDAFAAAGAAGAAGGPGGPGGAAAAPGPTGPPPLRESAPACREEIPDLLPALDQLIARCLRPRRDERPADAAEVMSEARAIIEATGLVTFLGRLAGGRPRMRAAAASLVTVLVSLGLSLVLAAGLVAVVPVPVDALRAALPATPALTRAATWPDVVLMPFDDGTLELVPAGTPGLATARPGRLERRSWRSLHAAAIRQAVAAGASVVWVDIFFETPDPEGDAALAAAIRDADAAGVPVILAARHLPAQPAGAPPIATALLEAGARWGGAAAEQSLAEGEDPLFQHDLLTLRQGTLLAPSMALLAAAHHVSGDRRPVFDGSDRRLLVRDGDAAWRRGSATMLAVPVTRALDAPDRADLRGLGILPGDRLLTLEIPVPDESSFDGATVPYERLWATPAANEPAIDGRIVLIYDQDHDAPTAAPVRRTARGHGWSAQAMLAGAGVQVARWWNIPLVVIGGIVGLVVGRIASRRHERRTARVAAGGGRRVHASLRLSIAVIVAAALPTVLLLGAATVHAHTAHALLLHPLPGVVASMIAATLILHGPRATDLVGRLGPRPRFATSPSATGHTP